MGAPVAKLGATGKGVLSYFHILKSNGNLVLATSIWIVSNFLVLLKIKSHLCPRPGTRMPVTRIPQMQCLVRIPRHFRTELSKLSNALVSISLGGLLHIFPCLCLHHPPFCSSGSLQLRFRRLQKMPHSAHHTPKCIFVSLHYSIQSAAEHSEEMRGPLTP